MKHTQFLRPRFLSLKKVVHVEKKEQYREKTFVWISNENVFGKGGNDTMVSREEL